MSHVKELADGGRVADLLARAAILYPRSPEPREQKPAPLCVALANDRDRLVGLGVAWTPDCARASSYAHWLRSHPAFVCAYCASPVRNTARARHADHVEPLSKGGLHLAENLVPSCQRCNLVKHAKDNHALPVIADYLTVAQWELERPAETFALAPAVVAEPVGWDDEWFEAWCRDNS